MDTVYSTKKYFQSLAGSDYYRSPSVSRQVGTDYTSYRDTVGRRSTLGPSYTHMSKYSYATDHSIGSHYGGYNGGWGLWRDTGNLSPAMSVTKKRSIKSFSIILMTAAFIVVLAVLSVAGLAFYFSTFRNDMDNSALAFDGQFHVLRGDVFTTGLKYNHTSAFRQKRAYYEKLIGTALQERGGMSVTKCEIDNFGGGPLIQVKFRVLLDMKSMPMTMTNVEEHIKQSLLQEVTSPGSPFKNIKIDPETMDVKRLLDHEMLKSASFMREIDHHHQPASSDETAASSLPTMTTKSTAFDEKVSKKSGVIEKTIHKFSATTSSLGRSPTAATGKPVTQPVIKGSYEITKTEADISEKKDTPPSQFHTTSTVPHGNHHHHPSSNKAPPPTTMKVKNGSGKFGTTPNSNATRPNLAKIDKIEKMNSTISSLTPSTTTTTSATPSSPVTSSASKTTLVLAESTTTTSSPTSSTTTASVSPSSIISTSLAKENPKSEDSDTMTTLPKLKNDNVHKYANNENLPQLDANLFTSAPILDSQPWHPIAPQTDQRKPDQRKGHPATLSTNTNNAEPPHSPIPGIANPALPVASGNEEASSIQQHRNKLMDAVTRAPTRPIYYQSFTNPTFSLTTLGIERLGAADVRPYPLPVNKLYNDELIGASDYGGGSGLDDDVGLSGMHLNEGEIMNNPQVHLDEYRDRFEHLGGGVSAKKPDLSMDRVEEYLVDGVTEPLEPKDTAEGIILDSDEPMAKPTKATAAAPSSTSSLPPAGQSDDAEKNEELGDILLDLLELNQEQRHKFVPEIDAVTAAPEEKLEETTKLNFINIREHILNKSKVGQDQNVQQQQHQHQEDSDSTTEQLMASPSVKQGAAEQQSVMMTTTMTPTTIGQPAAGNGVADQTTTTLAKPNWEAPALFPMHTTWELVNGTVTDQKQDQSQLRRVYNDTLQAWIVENSEEDVVAVLGANDSGDSDISSSKKKQEGTIQNISVIFDTLASKLGITPDVSSKSPPFQNKVRNRTTPPPSAPPSVTTSVKTKIVTTPPPPPTRTTTIAPVTKTSTARTTFRSTNAPVTEPEIITMASEEPEYDEEYEDDVEDAVQTTTASTTTTTTTTKKPRRKTTTKRRPVAVTTSKPRTVSPSRSNDNGSRPQSIRVAATNRPEPVTASTPRLKSTTTVPSKFRSTIVSSPTDAGQRAVPTTTTATVTESVIPAIFQLDPTSDDVVPIILSNPDAPAGAETYEMSSEAISFGKAEVEVVDPTVYEDLLRKQTTAMPPLVTLLPVRSNSGIRTFRTPMFKRSGEIETRRAFAKLPAVPPPARVVMASMSVGA